MNAAFLAQRATRFGRRSQSGVATLLITLVLLVVLTLIVLGSSNVALFEQKTATNENRERLAQQAAEYEVTVGAEYLKANITKISTNAAGGWFDPAGTIYWIKCPDTDPTDLKHPCYAEPNPTRRHSMYYYTTGGVATTDSTSTTLNLPIGSAIPTVFQMTAEGGATGAVFPVTTSAQALLCLLDTPPLPGTPSCKTFALRTNGQRVAVTLVGQASITGENANAIVKATYASFTQTLPVSAVPLAASGAVQGLGNAMIVASPNAGGFGLPTSIWSPQDVDVDSSGTGVGSVSTCQLGEYLGDVATNLNYKTVCAANNDPCRCVVSSTSSDFLSGHINGVKQEGMDIIDVDHSPWTSVAPPTNQPMPDLSFFPGSRPAGNNSGCVGARASATSGYCRLDTVSTTDDNLFEWIFNKDVNGGDFDGYPATTAIDTAEVAALDSYAAQHLTDCSSLSSTSKGLYYIEGACDLPNAQIGSPDNAVIVVANDDVQVHGSLVFYGMLFVRDTSTATCTLNGNTVPACLRGTGGKFFGSIVVEGSVGIAGSVQLVYVDTSGTGSSDPPPANTRFALVSGSWLDSTTGF